MAMLHIDLGEHVESGRLIRPDFVRGVFDVSS